MEDYKKNLKVLARGDKNEVDRADIIMKEMCRLMTDFIDYRYAVENYKGGGTVLADKVNTIKNSLAVLLGDVDVYMEYMNISGKVEEKKENRINNIAKKKM